MENFRLDDIKNSLIPNWSIPKNNLLYYNDGKNRR